MIEISHKESKVWKLLLSFNLSISKCTRANSDWNTCWCNFIKGVCFVLNVLFLQRWRRVGLSSCVPEVCAALPCCRWTWTVRPETWPSSCCRPPPAPHCCLHKRESTLCWTQIVTHDSFSPTSTCLCWKKQSSRTQTSKDPVVFCIPRLRYRRAELL